MDSGGALTLGIVIGAGAAALLQAVIRRTRMASEQSTPEWADAQLSADLPTIRSTGESQEVEFKREFPSNARDLAKEIAAFASTNNGTVLIGIDDDGSLVGLPDALTPEGRDKILQRLGGLCRGTIKPAVTPTARFAVEDGHAVLVVSVPRGSQPIYYSGDKPYVRHLTDSRPAEPHEVIDAVLQFARLHPTDESGASPASVFYDHVATILHSLQISFAEAGQRMVNPWLDQWRSEFASAANDLREESTSDVAEGDGIAETLQDVADRLDAVAKFRLFLGCGGELRALVDTAQTGVTELLRKLGDRGKSDLSPVEFRDAAERCDRVLQELVSRIPAMLDDGRISELQADASRTGLRLLQVSYRPVTGLPDQALEQLRSIGHKLHLVETESVHMDGGASMRRIAAIVHQQAEALHALLTQME